MHPRLQVLEKRFSPSILTPLYEPLFEQHQLKVYLKRDDLLDPIISGNKWRKLKYSLNHALTLDKNTLVSMGGAYSNHLHALAFTGKLLNLKTKGFIRGERPKYLNPTLRDLLKWGMTLEFISRSDYRQLRTYQHYDALPDLNANEYWLPEGGTSELALKGVAELIDEINQPFDWICSPCGTGTTLAGMINAVSKECQVLGISALKGGDFLRNEVKSLLSTEIGVRENWSINLNYHFGGFAKTKPELLTFIMQFEQDHGIEIEPIYSGKMLFALYDLIGQGYFNAGSSIIAMHTGGLQGKRSA
ncbi:MAG: pyridoxal-phosphate dependent enzyme [Methylococcales bacterium]|nr:pyridoxal-phosphate dependent enzyme [Methylococcales bacterium]